MERPFDEKFIRFGEVARGLGLQPGAVYMLVKKGVLPHPERVGQAWLFHRGEIERVIEQLEKG